MPCWKPLLCMFIKTHLSKRKTNKTKQVTLKQKQNPKNKHLTQKHPHPWFWSQLCIKFCGFEVVLHPRPVDFVFLIWKTRCWMSSEDSLSLSFLKCSLKQPTFSKPCLWALESEERKARVSGGSSQDWYLPPCCSLWVRSVESPGEQVKSW